jgi:hypothetical protein
MSSIQCPNCQCEISLGDRLVKRLAAAATWICAGGLLAALIVGFGLPKVGPPPLDQRWADEVRSAHKDRPQEAERLIAQRQAGAYNDWYAHMPALDRGVYEVSYTVKAIGVVLLCIGIPAGVLAVSIRPEPLQKRPPKNAA